MAGTQNAKLKLLYIADILNEKTDDEHFLAATEICDELEKIPVQPPIKAERKSIYNDLEVLKQYGMDIIHSGSKNRGGYHIGERKFELAELRLLLDAVQAANFITPSKTKKLIKKIESFASENQAKMLHSQVYVEKRPKCNNETIYYVIHNLDEAINKGVKVTFLYNRRKITDECKTATEEKQFTVSPYALIWSDDHYYLVCNNEKYDNLMHLRIDKIKDVEITSQKSRHFSEVSDYRDFFDSADYTTRLFEMYSGEPKPIELICKNDLLEPMLDKFGEKVKLRRYDDEHFLLRTNGIVSDGLVSWIVKFGGRIKVNKPQDLIYSVKMKAQEILNCYTEAPDTDE